MKKVLLFIIFAGLLVTGLNIFYTNYSNQTAEITTMTILGSEPKYNLEQLTNDSELVIRGVVEKVSEPKWNNKENNTPEKLTMLDAIYKDVTLKVNDVLKGTPPEKKSVKVRVIGGKVGDFTVVNENQPLFTLKDEIILFLAKDNTMFNKEKTQDHYILVGSTQGLYSITGEKASNVHEELDLGEMNKKIQEYILNPNPRKN
ncbi:MAG: hypothetical protein M0T74_03215 [Desulfitobacterium hafniense]|nr:hypothetical protein [Desulfitobacterium hafniense]